MFMIHRFIKIYFASLLVTGIVFAQTKINVPASLIYKYKPIDAICFNKPDGVESLVSCGIKFDHNLKKIGHNKIKNNNGLVGYNFKIKNSGPMQGYSFYRYISNIKNKDVIFTINNSGGTGDFTAIKTIARTSNDITIKTIQAGNRCNNGLSHIKINKHELTYRINITPFDILTLANDNPHHLKSYNGIVSCAVCCAGTMHLSRPLDGDFEKEKIISIDLTGYSLDQGGYGNDQPYQNCFNSLVTKYKAKNKTVFTLAELKTFVREFNKNCYR